MEKEKACDCAFCNSKCPECGSTHVYVECHVTWGYNKKNADDEIEMNCKGINLDLQCQDCGASLSDGDFDEDERLAPLRLALWKHLNLENSITITHKKGGKT